MSTDRVLRCFLELYGRPHADLRFSRAGRLRRPASDPLAIRAIAGRGCLFSRGVLDPVEICSVRSGILGQVQAAGWALAGCDAITAEPVPPARAARMWTCVREKSYTRIDLNPG